MNALKRSAIVAGAGPSVYVVDETEGLTELYTLFLKGTEFVVRPYNYRADVLAALTVNRMRPDLLVTDDLGGVDQFVERCRLVHPSLRVLMIIESGQRGVSLSCQRDQFIRKPFTADEFLQNVRAALDCPNRVHHRRCAHEIFGNIHVAVKRSLPQGHS